MKRLLGLILIVILGACSGHNGSKKTTEGDALEEGFELVDQGRYDEAIVYFQNIYDSNPSDDALKALASVYVTRAGVKVTTLYKAFDSMPHQEGVTRDNILPLIQAYKESLEQFPYAKDQDR